MLTSEIRQTPEIRKITPNGGAGPGFGPGGNIAGFSVWPIDEPRQSFRESHNAFTQGESQQRFVPEFETREFGLRGRLTGPVLLIQQLARAWSLNDDELAALLAYPSATSVGALREGRLTFETETDRGDRLRTLYMIQENLTDLFVDAHDMEHWIRRPLTILRDLSPLTYMIRNRIPGMLEIRDIVERRLGNR